MAVSNFPPNSTLSWRGLLGYLPLLAFFDLKTSAAPTTTAASACTATFSPISASAYVNAINPGWNLGNTLDAIPNEGSWNNPPVVGATFDDVKAAGFKSVRIPVTYTNHFTGSSPSWTIDPAWLQRVSDVIDLATSRGLYVITNIHHDSWDWADISKAGANLTLAEEKMYAAWVQIGQKLACKSSLVSFEPINEPPANNEADGNEINKLNDIFLKALAASGGYNTQRVVTLVGGGMDSIKTSQWFKAPASIKNPWALQFHYYSPYDFIFGAWGKTIWGSTADQDTLKADFANLRGNFTNVPIVLGEFDASPANCEPAARRKWTDVVTRVAKQYNIAVILWDNGNDNLDRNTHKWRDLSEVQVLVNAAKGVSNSLADATTDGSATTQTSSAYVFHKVGDAVTDQTLTFSLNGNTISSVKTSTGTALSSSTDYSVSGSSLTLKAAYLSKYLSATAAPGTKANLAVAFSAGASAEVEIVQWDIPTLGATSSKAVAGADLSIPITWKGLNRLATVKMISTDGTYLFDDWTQYLGPLQQARGTFSGQFNWNDQAVLLTSATVQKVISLGKPTIFTFEFFPRVPGHNATYTLNP